MHDLAVLTHAPCENAPDSVKPWGIWPELTSHLSQCYDALNCLEGCPISRARGDLTLLAQPLSFNEGVLPFRLTFYYPTHDPAVQPELAS